MEKPIFRKSCNDQLWLVILISCVSGSVFLCFIYAALSANRDGVTSLVNDLQDTISTHRSRSNKVPFSLNKTAIGPNEVPHPCSGRYIFIQDPPRRFSQGLLDNCETITAGTEHNMCPYLVNGGMGPEINNSEGILMNGSWYSTSQFSLSVIFHNKMKRYECLTKDSSLASAVYVPYYAGLDGSRYLWTANLSLRDQSAVDFAEWIGRTPEWKRMSGRDHFLVFGRPAWDFRRETDNVSSEEYSHWGSRLRFLPESKNMSMLSIESSKWNNDYAIPYPTGFHPCKDSEVFDWQEKMRTRKRQYLFSFAGAPRPDNPDALRAKVIEECQVSKTLCKLLECDHGPDGAIICDNPIKVMKLFQDSVFCLQPRGDSFTRRSLFDTILAGCIPVLFHPGSAYVQYKWYLPKNHSKYSVYIPVEKERDWRPGINETLLLIPEDSVLAMREAVIRLIPKVIYAHPSYRLETIKDAFDVAVNGILERIERVRMEIREGRDPDIGFAERDKTKYNITLFDGGN